MPTHVLLRQSNPNILLLILSPTILVQKDECLQAHKYIHRSNCRQVEFSTIKPLEDAMLRWQQKYFSHLRHLFGILAGLRPDQTRETQRVLLSRAVFQFFLGPKSPDSIPKSYRDLCFLRAAKVDVMDPSIEATRTTLLNLKAEGEAAESDPSQDTLYGLALCFYAPDTLRGATAFCFVVNSIPTPQSSSPPLGIGYPRHVTPDMVQILLNAHIGDNTK